MPRSLRCVHCNNIVYDDELDQVADSFDADLEHTICFPCARARWEKEQQDRQYNNPPQDEGDDLCTR